MKPGTREGKQVEETQALQRGKRHPSKTCRVSPVWRGRGAEKILAPPACLPCGDGGQERLYSKPTTETLRKGTMATCRRRHNVKVFGGGTECPIQVCQLSRFSESTQFFILGSNGVIRYHESPECLSRSKARASFLFRNFPDYETHTL